MVLDAIDRQILELLREDARRTISDIAERVSLSPAPVKRRIDRLEHAGVVKGYTVVLDESKVGPSLEAFVELRMHGNRDTDQLMQLAETMPEVREAYAMAGDPDVLLRIRVQDVVHLQRAVNHLRRSGMVTGTKTLMILSAWTQQQA